MADFRSQRSVWSTLTQYQFLLPCVCSKQVSFSLPQSLEISKYRIFSVQSVWISKASRVNFLFHIIFLFPLVQNLSVVPFLWILQPMSFRMFPIFQLSVSDCTSWWWWWWAWVLQCNGAWGGDHFLLFSKRS